MNILRLLAATLSVGLHATAQPMPLTVVSSATYGPLLAPEMIATGFSLAIRSGEAHSVTVADQPASVVGVASGQISFVIPAGLAAGLATVRVAAGGNLVTTGTAQLAAVAPGLYTANASGRGTAVGQLLKITADGTRIFDVLALASGLAKPFDTSEEGAQFFLQLYGTGMRGARQATATVGGRNVPVTGPVAQGDFAGLDQVNVGPLPPGFALGEVEIRLTANGVEANPVVIAPSLPGSGAWGWRAALLDANSEMSVAELNGQLYVLGGYPASRVTVATVQAYNPATDTWQRVAPLPRAVNHSMPAVVGGKIYIIGGQSDAGNASFVDTVYEYDPTTDRWRSRAALPRARGGGAAAVVDGKIYVAGSRPPRGADFTVYDPATDRWTELPDMPTQRNHLAAVAANGKVYLIGGRFEAGFQSPTTDTLEIFDPATRTWSKGPSMPNSRGGVNAVTAYGCIHVFGGEGNPAATNGLFPDHDVFNPQTGQWTKLAPMPIPVHGVTGLAFLGGLIYLPGGGISQGGSSGGTQNQVFRPSQICQ